MEKKEELEKKTGVKCISSIDGIKCISSLDGIKRFSFCVMNPPYDKSLHLKFLEKVIEVTDKVVTVQPVRWIIDPLAEQNKNSNYNKYNKSISEHIEDLEVLSQKYTDALFGIQFNTKIGIYTCSTNGGFDYNSVRDMKHIELLNKVLKKSKNIPNIILYKDSQKDNFVPVCLLAGHIAVNEYGAGIGFARPRYEYFINNKCQSRRFFGQTPSQCKSYNLKTFDTVCVVEFNTKEETKNFYKYITSSVFDYFVKKNASDGHINPKYLPFVDNYKHEWSNKELCKYFNIDGFVSDTEGKKGSEWEKILTTINYWKEFYNKDIKKND